MATIIVDNTQSQVSGTPDADDIFLLNGASVSGSVLADDGNDTIEIADGAFAAFVFTGAGDDTVMQTGGTTSYLYVDNGSDSITVSGGSTNFVFSGGGAQPTDQNSVSISGTGVVNYGLYLSEAGDSITVTDSGRVSYYVYTYAGDDRIEVSGSGTIGGSINAGEGANSINLSEDGRVTASISGGGGDDTVSVTGNGSVGYGMYLGGGENLVSLSGYGSIGFGVYAADGDDMVYMSDSSSVGTGIGLSGGDDTIVLSGTAQVGTSIYAGTGNDSVSIEGTASVGGNVFTGEGSDAFSISGGTVASNVDTGAGDDLIVLSGGTIGGALYAAFGNDTVVVSGLDGNLVLDGGEDPDDADIDTLDLRALGAGTLVFTPGDPESGVFTQDGSGLTITFDNFENVLCFSGETLLESSDGWVRADELQVGMLLETADHGAQSIRWLGKREISREEAAHSDKLWPVEIEENAFAPGYPDRTLRLTRHHRVMLSSKVARKMFGSPEILVPVKDLLDYPGVTHCDPAGPLTYVHVLLDQHEILFANGLPAESLLLGPNAVDMLTHTQLEEIVSLFPNFSTTLLPHEHIPARPCVHGRRVQRLLFRHRKNSIPLCDASLVSVPLPATTAVLQSTHNMNSSKTR